GDLLLAGGGPVRVVAGAAAQLAGALPGTLAGVHGLDLAHRLGVGKPRGLDEDRPEGVPAQRGPGGKDLPAGPLHPPFEPQVALLARPAPRGGCRPAADRVAGYVAAPRPRRAGPPVVVPGQGALPAAGAAVVADRYVWQEGEGMPVGRVPSGKSVVAVAKEA